MRAFIKFNKGMMKMSTPVRLWLLSLVTMNMVVPLFFLYRLEAQVVLGTVILSMVFMTSLTALSGFSRLVGVGHLPWIPMLYWLWTRLDQIPMDDGFGLWIRVLLLLNSISLIMDAVDAMRYVAGDREEVVKDLEMTSI